MAGYQVWGSRHRSDLEGLTLPPYMQNCCKATVATAATTVERKNVTIISRFPYKALGQERNRLSTAYRNLDPLKLPAPFGIAYRPTEASCASAMRKELGRTSDPLANNTFPVSLRFVAISNLFVAFIARKSCVSSTLRTSILKSRGMDDSQDSRSLLWPEHESVVRFQGHIRGPAGLTPAESIT